MYPSVCWYAVGVNQWVTCFHRRGTSSIPKDPTQPDRLDRIRGSLLSFLLWVPMPRLSCPVHLLGALLLCPALTETPRALLGGRQWLRRSAVGTDSIRPTIRQLTPGGGAANLPSFRPSLFSGVLFLGAEAGSDTGLRSNNLNRSREPCRPINA